MPSRVRTSTYLDPEEYLLCHRRRMPLVLPRPRMGPGELHGWHLCTRREAHVPRHAATTYATETHACHDRAAQEAGLFAYTPDANTDRQTAPDNHGRLCVGLPESKCTNVSGRGRLCPYACRNMRVRTYVWLAMEGPVRTYVCGPMGLYVRLRIQACVETRMCLCGGNTCVTKANKRAWVKTEGRA